MSYRRFFLIIALSWSVDAGEFPPIVINPALNPLPPDVLAFPTQSENYRARIISGDLEIWSEEKIIRWALAQGLVATKDHQGGGQQWHRAAVITAPGLKFTLQRPVTEKGSQYANGWSLILDVAKVKAKTTKHNYSNILEADILIDGVYYYTISQGLTKSDDSRPIQIEIPHIRDPEGKIEVELRLANHPRNFLFLYDAYLSR